MSIISLTEINNLQNLINNNQVLINIDQEIDFAPRQRTNCFEKYFCCLRNLFKFRQTRRIYIDGQPPTHIVQTSLRTENLYDLVQTSLRTERLYDLNPNIVNTTIQNSKPQVGKSCHVIQPDVTVKSSTMCNAVS